MEIKNIELFHLKMPLKFKFKTAIANFDYRETMIIKLTDENCNIGYGEVVSFKEPFYTSETLDYSREYLIKSVFPLLKGAKLNHPFDIHKCTPAPPQMAMSGIENALLDLYGKRTNTNIMDLVFSEDRNENIKTGIALGDIGIEELKKKIQHHMDKGCTRFKIKIKPGDGFSKIKALIDDYPYLDILVDANRSFNEEDIEELKRLDELNLKCIEEPLNTKDLSDYLNIKDKLKTPICLDESILAVEDLNLAVSLGIIDVLNIKIGRVGGLYYVKEIIDICRKNDIDFWIGSMVESGISKILHVQLASLKDTLIPGDISASSRYFEKDLVNPEIIDLNGTIAVPRGVGIGVDIDEEVLREYMISSYKL